MMWMVASLALPATLERKDDGVNSKARMTRSGLSRSACPKI